MKRSRHTGSGVVVVAAVALTCVGCSSTSSHTEVVKSAPVQFQVKSAPGIVEYAWEEPMVDIIDVPPGLDPEGRTYRPGHQEVVEIRQGRWQYYKRPQN